MPVHGHSLSGHGGRRDRKGSVLVKPDELRQRRDSGESCSVKLPMRHSVLVDMKRVELKDICRRNDLPPDYFSAHSLSKGGITHMRAQGVTEDDRRDRGNYAAGSQVMNLTYDYATGLGPLASNGLEGGREPTLEDVKRLIPTRRRSL
jgi:hypothetical protein